MSEPAVLYTSHDRVGRITLNRPDNRNSMTPELLDAFASAVERAKADADARCIVITGRGACFSAGADFKAGVQRAEGGPPSAASFAMYEPFLSVLDLTVPVIAALNGHTVGGGFGLALVCDIRVANRASKYGANFARIGLHSGMGISYTLPRLVGLAHASELLFSGQLIDGARAAAIGLVNHAVAADEVASKADELASAIARSAPLAVRGMKAAMRRGSPSEIRETARQEAYAQAESLASNDAREGMAALLEKREPQFVGS
jgi:enoyl-CoA hydratase/carnithine racemase